MNARNIERLNDELLSAYLDGELPPAECAWLESRLATDAEARKRLHAYRLHDIALKRHYEPVLDEPIPRRLLEIIDNWAARIPSPGNAKESF